MTTHRGTEAPRCMRVLKLPVGLLLNFNGETLRSGVRRLAI